MRRLFSEWTAQDAVLLAWPHAQTDWNSLLPAIEDVYLELVSHITRFERVVILCGTDAVRTHVISRLAQQEQGPHPVALPVVPYNDTWLRDSGPISFELDGTVALADFHFNGWGGKFDARLDDALTATLAARQGFAADVHSYPLFLEGGSIDCDGEGTLLTTAECLLTPTRNPEMTQQDYADFFARAFGIKRVLWLTRGELAGDDTDGHIDMLARFCNATTIAYTACDRPDDPHYAPLQAMVQELTSFTTAEGQPYKLVALPIPQPILASDGHRLPASYANFLIINGAVLVPVYEDENDALVLSRLAECFPGREIIAINARPIIEQHGSLHCLTMQLAAGTLSEQISLI